MTESDSAGGESSGVGSLGAEEGAAAGGAGVWAAVVLGGGEGVEAEAVSGSGVLDVSVVCETVLREAVKGSRKVGGSTRESRHARLAARERNMIASVVLIARCTSPLRKKM